MNKKSTSVKKKSNSTSPKYYSAPKKRKAESEEEVEVVGGTGSVLNVLTAIIYPAIFLIISIGFIYNQVEPNLTDLALCVGLNVLFSICLFISGAYLIIIPLPIVYYFTWGSKRNKVPLLVKILLNVGGVGCGLFSLVVCGLI